MRVRRFFRETRGAASLITALSATALIGFTGLAVDVGAVYMESRRLQGAADLAALAAVQTPAQAHGAATATVRANGWHADTSVDVTSGVYTPSRDIRPRERFRANAASANAVRVQLRSSTPLYFGRLFVPHGRMTITRHATASQTRLASFQIGSRLLSLQGGVANDVLSTLTGSTVSLSVMDYESLLRADVDLFSYVEALRTRLDIEAATYNETLAHRVEAPAALQALADVLAGQDARAERAMRRLAESASRAGEISRLNQVIDLGPYAAQDHTLSGPTQVRVSAFDLASAVLQIAGGDRQVRLQLGASLPGLTSTDVWLAIGERPNNSPWLSITDDYDVVVRTAQMRLYVETRVRPGGALGVAEVRLPLLLELASAQAKLSDIRCGSSERSHEVTLAVAPSIGSLSLGAINVSDLDNFRRTLTPTRATLVRTSVLQVEGNSRIELGGQEWRNVRFSGSDIANGTVKSVATRDAARATISSLFGGTDLTVRALGLGVGTSAVTGLLRGTLTSVASPLDGLINGLTDLLGVRLGEADVRVNGVRCGGAALVA